MKKKGFTLIELLAVIVILGLLMAIAIPSVTKYITESRKKTVTTTIGNYIGALTNQVNDFGSTKFKLDLGDKFDTSNVVDMNFMFSNTGYQSTVFTLELGDKFDTSSVTNMSSMFTYLGYHSQEFKLNLKDKFDTSNVTDMSYMFQNTGYNTMNFTLNLGGKFGTSNVIYMNQMFYNTGYKSTAFNLDCSSWNVDKVTSHADFNKWVESKVIAPTWK